MDRKMKSLSVLSVVFLLLVGFSSASLDDGLVFSDTEHDFDENIVPGETKTVNFTVDNERVHNVTGFFEFIFETERDTSFDEDLFDIELEVEGESYDSCSFEEDDKWIYKCPEEGHEINTEDSYDVKANVSIPVNIEGGENLLDLEVKGPWEAGSIEERKDLTGAEDPEVILGDLTFNVEGGDEIHGNIARYSSIDFEDPSDAEHLEYFGVNLNDTDSVEMTYNFSESLIEKQDYEFELYGLTDEWNEVDFDVSEDETHLTSSIQSDRVYSLYINRTELTLEELRDRETEIDTSVDGGNFNISFDGLGEGENVTVEDDISVTRGSNTLTGLEFISNVNETAEVEVNYSETSDEEIDVEDFQVSGYLDVETGDQMDLSAVLHEVDNSSFNSTDDVAAYRYDDEDDDWNLKDTAVESEGEDTTTFRSETSNSVVALGVLQSIIEIEDVEFPETVLDNKTVDVKVEMENTGRAGGTKELNLSIEGEENVVVEEGVNGNSERTATVSADLDPGTYSLELAGEEGEVDVELRPFRQRLLDSMPFDSMLLLNILLVVIAALLLGAVYFVARLLGFNPDLPDIRGIMGSDGEEEQEVNEEKEDSGGGEKESVDKEVERDGHVCEECGEVFDTAEGLDLHETKFH